MTDVDLTQAIDWLYGGHDSFQHDDVLKSRVVEALRADDKRATRILTAYASELLKPPYTIEDVAKFIQWLDYDLDYSL